MCPQITPDVPRGSGPPALAGSRISSHRSCAKLPGGAAGNRPGGLWVAYEDQNIFLHRYLKGNILYDGPVKNKPKNTVYL